MIIIIVIVIISNFDAEFEIITHLTDDYYRSVYLMVT